MDAPLNLKAKFQPVQKPTQGKFNLFDFQKTPPMSKLPVEPKAQVSFGPQKQNYLKPTVNITAPTSVQASTKYQPNSIQSFLDYSKGNPQLETRRNAVIEMLKKGIKPDDIEDTILNKMQLNDFAKSMTQNKTIGGRLEEVAKKSSEKMQSNLQSDRGVIGKELGKAGVIGSTISGVVGAGIGELFESAKQGAYAGGPTGKILQGGKAVGENFMKSPEGKTLKTIGQGLGIAGSDIYGRIPENTQRNIEDVGSIAMGALDVAGVGATGKQILKSGKLLGQDVVSGVQKTRTAISNVPTNIKGKVGQTTENIGTSLTKEQIKGMQSNPYQAEEYTKMTARMDSPEGIADIKDYKTERAGQITDELVTKIDEIKSAKGETSEVYKQVRELNTQVQTQPLFESLNTTISKNGMTIKNGKIKRMAGSKAKDLNQSDITKFQQIYDDLVADASKGYLTPDEILTFRQTASNLAKYDATTTTTGQGIMRAIRKDIDNTAKAQVPGLKELDAIFVDKLEELEEATKDLVYKGGDVKGEYRSNIVNIISTLDKSNRSILLKRLEEVMPGIGERIKAIDNLPTLFKAIDNKGPLEKYTGIAGATIGANALGTVVPGLGHVGGFILGYKGGQLLERGISAGRKLALKKALSKVSPEGIKKLKVINTKIKNKELLSKPQKDYLNKIKSDYESNIKNNPVKPTPDSSRGGVGFDSRNGNSNSNTQPPVKKQLLLPAGKKSPIITPQTAEKGLIQESKTELSKAKIVNPMLKKSDKLNDYDIYKQGIDEANTISELDEIKEFVKTHPRAKELLEEIDAKIDTIRAFQSIKDDVGGNLRTEYGDDLINAFKEVYKNEIMLKTTKGADKYSTIEFNKSAGFKRLTGKIEEYLSKSPWEDRTVQEVYETLKDKMVNASVKDLNKPKLLKPTKSVEKTPAQVQEAKKPTQAPKLLKKESKLSNNSGFINPTAIAQDITKAIKTLTPKNILLVSKQIATRLKVDTIKVQKILREYMTKYGAELKDKAGDLFDDLADRLGVRSKLVDGKGTGISGKIEAPKELIEEARKYKSAEEFYDKFTAKSIMDLSDRAKHKYGRLLEDGVDEDTMRYMDAKYTADIYGSRGNNAYKWQKDAMVPDVKSKEDIVTIYRGTKKSQKEMEPGDFVSFSKEYASGHNVEGGHVISIKVPAKDVVWQGADLHEWIYSPEKLRGGEKYNGGLKKIWQQANK